VRALENVEDCRRMREDARRTVVERYELDDVCLPRQMSMLEEARGIPV